MSQRIKNDLECIKNHLFLGNTILTEGCFFSLVFGTLSNFKAASVIISLPTLPFIIATSTIGSGFLATKSLSAAACKELS